METKQKKIDLFERCFFLLNVTQETTRGQFFRGSDMSSVREGGHCPLGDNCCTDKGQGSGAVGGAGGDTVWL